MCRSQLFLFGTEMWNTKASLFSFYFSIYLVYFEWQVSFLCFLLLYFDTKTHERVPSFVESMMIYDVKEVEREGGRGFDLKVQFLSDIAGRRW